MKKQLCNNNVDFVCKKRTLKTLSSMAIAGVLALSTQAYGVGIEDAMKNKPVNTPTLEYLKDNNILIPQKDTYDSETKKWTEKDAIKSSGSGYTISDADKNDYTFKYTTADKEGNLTDKYYKVNLKAIPQNMLDLLSDSIKWEELTQAPEEGTADVITVKLSDNVTKYYKYTYTKPSNYTETSTRINGITGNIENVLFRDIKSTSSGAAIYNIKNENSYDVVADFVNNNTSGISAAIYNTSKINNIIGDFVDNTVAGSSAAIYNGAGTISNITANFINNSSSGNGGAIRNQTNGANSVATIGTLTGVFINNSGVRGGVIFNNADPGVAILDNISGIFINNSSTKNGGVILNGADNPNGTAKIGNIDGIFINNHTDLNGGVINNLTENNGITSIDNISGIFINNSAGQYGGAIYNSAVISNITADFISNSAIVYGGAIYNAGTTDNITGDFIGNTAHAYGGAIYNTGTIGDITGDFINNSAGIGAAIYNESGNIGNITGNFINNSTSRDGGAGAIYNSGTLSYITGNFINNSAIYGFGGAISNVGTIGKITGDFINNSDKSGYGGAIANSYGGNISYIDGNFVNNSSGSYGGAIYNYGKIGNIKGNFIKNATKYAPGGAIYNTGTIGNIIGDFVENKSPKAYGGAIVNEDKGKIAGITGNFINNTSYYPGGAIYNYNNATIGNITGDFKNNISTNGPGGALYNSGTIGLKDADGNVIGGIINSSFIENSAKSGSALGGAIWTSNDLNIIAKDNYTSVFKGNYTETNGVKDDNAIYTPNFKTNINFKLHNGGKVAMYDNIRGAKGYKVNIVGDDINNTAFYMYNDMYDASLSLNNTTINTINNNIHTYNLNHLSLSGNTNMVADVDLQAQTIDRFTAESYGDHAGKLIVNGANLLSDANHAEIYFAEKGLKDNVVNGIKTVYSPLYKYDISYDNREDGGYFVFGQAGGSNKSDSFNPAVLTAPVGTQAASNATVNETFKYVFEHADMFTQMPFAERISAIKQNQYAISTDFNQNLGSINTEMNNKAGWFRPYVTFENMNLKNGPKVDAITYGSLVGFDSDFQTLKHGWTGITTGYIGYNGNQLSYKGVDTTMNGGLIGLTQTLYKGNFWTALTLSTGASVGESNTMYGKEDFTSLFAGVGSKTGYNFEFKEGRYIIQPIMFMSYTFVNTFDYTNAAGLKINNDPMHSILLNPSVRFITNTKNGWQPYISVGMVWNVMNESNVTANNVKLPDMKIKPYVEYGLGIQKRFKDNFTAFGQAMIRNGGRNGISLTTGFRWNIGKTKKNIERVYTPKVIKAANS